MNFPFNTPTNGHPADTGINTAGMILCPYCRKMHYSHQTCVPLYQETPIGCACPPGANILCQNPVCPRKPRLPLTATGTI